MPPPPNHLSSLLFLIRRRLAFSLPLPPWPQLACVFHATSHSSSWQGQETSSLTCLFAAASHTARTPNSSMAWHHRHHGMQK